MGNTWEDCVIGTIVSGAGNQVDTAKMQEAIDLLPSDFTGINSTVWSCMRSLNDAEALSRGALVASLASTSEFKDKSEAEAFLGVISQYAGPNLGQYCKQVLETSNKKQIMKMASYIAAEAREEKTQVADIMDYTETEMTKLRRGKSNSVSMGDLMAIFTPRLKDIMEGNFKPAWAPKCLAVNKIVQYAEEDEFIIIAGRPGEGKSSYLRFEGYHFASMMKPVEIINLENSPIEYARAFLSLRTGIDNTKFKNGKLTEAENQIRIAAAMELAKLPIYIDFANEIHQIKRLVKQRVAEKGIKLVVLDYIQLIRNKAEKRVDDLSMTTGTLKAMSMELKVPIIGAAQLSRGIEYRPDAEPELSDLRESGSLEQDANMVIFPRIGWNTPTPEQIRQFPENSDPFTNRLHDVIKAVPVVFYVKKNRNGAIGKSEPVKWNKSTGNYQPLQRTE
jgi:replicative DNA helicase